MFYKMQPLSSQVYGTPPSGFLHQAALSNLEIAFRRWVHSHHILNAFCSCLPADLSIKD